MPDVEKNTVEVQDQNYPTVKEHTPNIPKKVVEEEEEEHDVHVLKPPQQHNDDKDNNINHHNGGLRNGTSRRTKEKLVYKVVPVPYYYPVPVDAEWYYKHYEPSSRKGEHTPSYPEDAATLEGFPFPPPPAYGMTPPRSALREPFYYSSTRDEDERFLRAASPLFRHNRTGSKSLCSPLMDIAKLPRESSTHDHDLLHKKKRQIRNVGDEGFDEDQHDRQQQHEDRKNHEDNHREGDDASTSSHSPKSTTDHHHDHISPRSTASVSIKSELDETEDGVGGREKKGHAASVAEDGRGAIATTIIDKTSSLNNKDDKTGSMDENSDNASKSDVDEQGNEQVSPNINNRGGGNHDDSEVSSRKRRRFPMTFPYDQRKKMLKENGLHSPNPHHHYHHHHHYRKGEGKKHHHSPPLQYPSNGRSAYLSEGDDDYKQRSRSEDPESRMYSSHKYASSNGGTGGGHYPYVMVPVRSPSYVEAGRPPRYSERGQYYESRLYDEAAYAPKDSMSGGRLKNGGDLDLGDDCGDDDKQREIRYHPNGRRARTVFTRQQLLTLNNVFEKHPFVSGERMSELSDQLGLDRKIVKIWFQNKRQYARKKGSLVERGSEEFYYADYPTTVMPGDRYNPEIGSTPPSMAAEQHWKTE